MLLAIDFIIFNQLPSRINQNQIPNNSLKSIYAAIIALIIVLIVNVAVTFLLQQAAFFQGAIDTSSFASIIQSTMRHGFASTGLDQSKPIFANSLFLTIYYFGIVIPFIETRFIIRLMEATTRFLNIPLDKMSLKLVGVYIIIAGLFVWIHFAAKGVTDNIALILTFIFGIITFEIARIGYKFRNIVEREMESATYLHSFNNIFSILNILRF